MVHEFFKKMCYCAKSHGFLHNNTFFTAWGLSFYGLGPFILRPGAFAYFGFDSQ